MAYLPPASRPTLAIDKALAARFRRHVDPGTNRMAVPPRYPGPTRSDLVVTMTVTAGRHRANPGVALHAITGSRLVPGRIQVIHFDEDLVGALGPDEGSGSRLCSAT